MVVKGFTIALLLIGLSGCASFVANKITSPKNINVEGNLADLIVERQICDNSPYCIKTMGLGDLEAGDLSLAFTFKINEGHKVWRYEAKSDGAAKVKPLENQLIVLFAGYSQPTLLLYMHQRWLQHITGANVIVVPSADNSENFKFGLDYASPLVAEIQRLKPKKVHLIGFSMGALAANAVEQEVDNARLYLFAPMTDFEHSTKAIYDILYQDTLYAKFVSKNTLEDAIQIVYEESGTTLKDTDLLAKLNGVKSPTFIYASNTDKVTDYSALNTIDNKNINVSIYEKLGHIEMVALASQNLLTEFVSDLLERPVLQSEVETLGVLCDFGDDDCLNQLPN
ncbi:hypothetical protein SAMN06297229_2241 [Pseudidiomarina planktonica]|uniref:Pimeloyl-ACP methyl ester carboxylesterase n=1 Tax=Pseudidiomarina planktonica TaxID=1323738 RepID=A0A1Y6G4B9_9GAMM|nr:hypothetical protein [Pseudidiomarina planktonica]RUO63298.1 hypothetical protein CWI77_10630 [Pseudidiomarina planktonica]SMQ80483.1 hypothetical protein SAMN06297229_2241 [Pseudidiomarina planktonica]